MHSDNFLCHCGLINQIWEKHLKSIEIFIIPRLNPVSVLGPFRWLWITPNQCLRWVKSSNIKVILNYLTGTKRAACRFFKNQSEILDNYKDDPKYLHACICMAWMQDCFTNRNFIILQELELIIPLSQIRVCRQLSTWCLTSSTFFLTCNDS